MVFDNMTLFCSNGIISSNFTFSGDLRWTNNTTFQNGLALSSADGINKIPLTVTNTDTTNNPRAVDIANSTTANAVRIVQTGATSSSTSVGGAFLLTNTANTGAGIVVYSNSATGTGHLIVARADNAAFDGNCYYGTSAGTGHTALFLKTGTEEDAAACTVSSSNSNFTAFQVSGVEEDHGTIKVTHTKPAASDVNAAGVSIDLVGSGTAAKGLYINSTVSGGTTGLLIDARNDTTARCFAVGPTGAMYIADSITTPSGITGLAGIYVESGNVVKIKFSDGTIKTFTTS